MTSPLQPKGHEVSIKDAADMTRRHRNQASVQGLRKLGDGDLGGLFTKDAVLKLLQQPGCAYMRFYYGRGQGGQRNIVLVASDAEGNDVTTASATILEDHYLCPPFCPTGDGSPLRSDT